MKVVFFWTILITLFLVFNWVYVLLGISIGCLGMIWIYKNMDILNILSKKS